MEETDTAVLPTTSASTQTQEISLYDRVYQWIVTGPPMLFTWTMFRILLTLFIMSCLAIFTYGSFYYTYIPQSTLSRHLYFQRTEQAKERRDAEGYRVKTIVGVLHVELQLFSEDGSFLSPGQSYNIDLELDMPESEVNYGAGTFMVSSHYYDKLDKLLTSSSRLVMIRYKSWLLRALDTIFYAPLYLLGMSEQTQMRKIQLFNNYNENAYRPTKVISIDIDNPSIQIYGATITLSAQFSGLRYYMYYWPITTAMIGVSFIWGMLFVVLGSSWLALNIDSTEQVNRVHQEQQPTHANAAQLRQSTTVEDQLAPNEPDTSLSSTERASIHIDNHTEVANLGVTPLDSSDMMKHEPIVRRRNHLAEQPST